MIPNPDRLQAHFTLESRPSFRLMCRWTRLLLAPGGILLYATCSLLPEENDVTVLRFLEDEPSASEDPIQAPWGVPRQAGRQVPAGSGGMDGFYYARLIKR
ncbi:hypothetical protein CKO33_06230 [Ectothiorhodospira mobilis]|nr:hypothetical protein [Ectothiorhodospira mobilis]